jgi:dienelactone hydrolase
VSKVACCPAIAAVAAGGGAALWAAAYLDSRVSAVVVRGGRPDLAADKLPAVTAPTLLLVGGNDSHVLDLNRAALQVLGSAGGSALVVVPSAGHLFEGPGQLEAVAGAACEWFGRHLKQQQQQQQHMQTQQHEGDKQAGVIPA